MRAEIIAIGSELLLGDNTDTNSAWLSRRLSELGVEVVRHTAVSDGMQDMVTALQEALARAEVVVTTGGLGPTQDDLTRYAVGRLAGVEVVHDREEADAIAAYFTARGRSMPEANLQQADLPDGAWWLSRAGSAAGFAMEVEGSLVVSLPGVPSEMRTIFDADVAPLLRRRGGLATTVSRFVRTSGRSESGIADDLAEVARHVEADGRMRLAFLASRGETRVKVTATAADRQTALSLVDPVVEEIVAALGHGVVGLDDEGVEHAIGRRLSQMGMTVAVAESITGGGVGARLVTVPGASAWFRGGLIAYATPTKTLLAGIEPGMLEGSGPVSPEVARELAEAAADRLEADFGVGVVGVAGPDPVGEDPVGLVRVAVVGPDGHPRVRDVSIGDRGRLDIQHFAASAALNLMLRAIDELAG